MDTANTKMAHVAIVNGPNLNRIGRREVSIYGNASFDDFLISLRLQYSELNVDYFQSNVEGELIDYLYSAVDAGVEGVVLNAGAYTHTSIALLDAIRAIEVPVIEVHLSNIHAREAFRHTSVIAPACKGGVYGMGLESYRLGLEALLSLR